MAERYPLLLDLTGVPCLVVGGGAVATRKVLGLLAAEAAVTVISPTLAAPLAQLAGSKRIRWVETPYRSVTLPEVSRPWGLVIAATDHLDTNAQVASDAARLGVWANVVTEPDGGAAAVPASWRQGPVTLAVSTSGAHPAAARWLCDEAAASISPEVIVALELVEEVRRDDAAGGGPGRRPDWRCAVASGTLELIRAGHRALAKERLQACLSSSSD